MERLRISQLVGLSVMLGLVAVQMTADVAKLSAEIASAVRFLVSALTLIMVFRRHPRARAAIEATGWVIIGSVGLDYYLHHPIPRLEFAQCALGAVLLMSSFAMKPLLRRPACDIRHKPTMTGGV